MKAFLENLVVLLITACVIVGCMSVFALLFRRCT